MRYTPTLVTDVAREAASATSGTVRLDGAANLGREGMRYTDGASDRRWTGRDAGQQAAYHYARAAALWLIGTGMEVNEWPPLVLAVVVHGSLTRSTSPAVRRAGVDGAHRAYDALGRGLRQDLPPRVSADRDGQGRTAEEFLREHFEYESCAECLEDREGHAAGLDPLGNWHAWCAARPPVLITETVDGVDTYIRLGSVTRVPDYNRAGGAWAARSIHRPVKVTSSGRWEHVQMLASEWEADEWVRKQHALFISER